MAIAFRAAAGSNTASTGTTAAVTVPAGVQSGDFLILKATRALTDATAATPAGWSLLAGPVDRGTSLREYVFTRKAGSGDASTSVTVTWSLSASAKRHIELVAYSGADPTTPVVDYVSAVEAVSGTTHTAPTVTTTRDGSWLVGFGSDRASPGSVDLIPPAGLVERDQQNSSGGGGTTTAVADSNGPVTTGTAGGGSWTGDVATVNAITWTLAIQPPLTAVPTILVGAALRIMGGESTAQAIVNRDTEYGRLAVHRIFFGGVPNWTSPQLITGRPLAVSFKMDPAQVNAGTYDAAMRTWFSAASARAGKVWWSYYHEPEDNFTTSTAKAAYRLAFTRLINISKEPGMPANLVATPIFMDWTFDSASGRNWLDWLPTGADTIGVDIYEFNEPGLQSWTAHMVRRPSYDVVTAAGYPYAIPEVAYNVDGGTAGEYANRVTLIGQMSAWASGKDDIDYITYFDAIGPLHDQRLLDSASQVALGNMIDALEGTTAVTLTPVTATLTPRPLTLTPTVVLTPVTASFVPVPLGTVQPNVTLTPVTASFSVVPLFIPPPSAVTLVPVIALFDVVPLTLLEGAVVPVTRKFRGPFRTESWALGPGARLAVKVTVNQTLYRVDGVWKVGENLTYLDVENADRLYYGGYDLELSNDRLDELVAAGLGQYVVNI